MRYRADIDGLRSVAVMIVVLFHMGLHAMSGGFVGVDVFFVISGFLITTLVLRDIDAKRFSFQDFYMRRLRRLGPALLVTLLATLVAGHFVLAPAHYEMLGRSAKFTVLSVSNVLFWMEAGYFDEQAIYKPLLHTWSLAVEEQFYLIWPTLVLLSARFGHRGVVFCLGALSILSLVAAELLMQRDATAVFFLTPFRVYEFACGAVLALLPSASLPRVGVRSFASLVGGAMILAAAFLYNEATRFPGVTALLPCLGAALIIWAGPDARMNRILSREPFRYVGRISYSLYLVHWPLVVFYSYRHGTPGSAAEVAGLTFAAIALGSFMYHWVEMPFRRRGGEDRAAGFRVSERKLGWSAAVTATVTLVLAGTVEAEKGLPERMPAELRRLDQLVWDGKRERRAITRTYACEFSPAPKDGLEEDFETCLPEGEDKVIVVLGDSHATDLWIAIEHDNDRSAIKLRWTGCSVEFQSGKRDRCIGLLDIARDWIEDNRSKVDLVLYTQRAGNFLRGEAESGPAALSINTESIERVRDGLEEIAALGVDVVFWGPRPEFHPTIGVTIGTSTTVEEFRERMNRTDMSVYAELDAELARTFDGGDVTYLSSVTAFCNPYCLFLQPDGRPLIIDYGHWAPQGGQYALATMLARYPELADRIDDRAAH